MNARRKWVAYALVGGTALIGACAENADTRGNFIDLNKVETFKKDNPSKADVVREFGPPSADTTFQSQKWYYMGETIKTWAFLQPEVTERRIVIFTFDDEDRVKSVEVRGADVGRDINPVRRVIPDLGHDDSTVKEIFGNVGKIHKGTVASAR